MEFQESGTTSFGAPEQQQQQPQPVSEVLVYIWGSQETLYRIHRYAITCSGITEDDGQPLECREVDLVGGISRDRQTDVGWNGEIGQVIIQPVILGDRQVRGKGGVCDQTLKTFITVRPCKAVDAGKGGKQESTHEPCWNRISPPL